MPVERCMALKGLLSVLVSLSRVIGDAPLSKYSTVIQSHLLQSFWLHRVFKSIEQRN